MGRLFSGDSHACGRGVELPRECQPVFHVPSDTEDAAFDGARREGTQLAEILGVKVARAARRGDTFRLFADPADDSFNHRYQARLSAANVYSFNVEPSLAQEDTGWCFAERVQQPDGKWLEDNGVEAGRDFQLAEPTREVDGVRRVCHREQLSALKAEADMVGWLAIQGSLGPWSNTCGLSPPAAPRLSLFMGTGRPSAVSS